MDFFGISSFVQSHNHNKDKVQVLLKNEYCLKGNFEHIEVWHSNYKDNTWWFADIKSKERILLKGEEIQSLSLIDDSGLPDFVEDDEMQCFTIQTPPENN